jgi:hypothetical protein
LRFSQGFDMPNVFKKWMSAATLAERVRLARLAKTTVGSLSQVAGGYRTLGRPSTGPELARRIEIASVRLARDGLPSLKREDLCQACGKCEYAKKAKA